MTRPAKYTLAAVVLVIGLAALGLALFDGSLLKGLAERQVTARTGRELTIAGDFRVAIRRRIHIVAEDVRLANPPGASQPEAFAARRVAAALSLPALLAGRLDLHDLELVQPRLAFERTGDRGPEPFELSDRLRIRRLRIDAGTMRFTDPAARTDVTVRIAAAGTGGDDDLKLAARGTYRGAPLTAEARGPTVLLLADTSTPYPFVAQVRAGATAARIQGSFTDPAALG